MRKVVVEKLRAYSKELRYKQTESEKRFEEIYKSHARARYRIIPQRIFFFNLNTGYIVDFYIPKLKLVFEIDGDSHKYQTRYDQQRTNYLESRGIKVYRISNHDVKDKLTALRFIGECISKQERLLLLKERKSILDGIPKRQQDRL